MRLCSGLALWLVLVPGVVMAQEDPDEDSVEIFSLDRPLDMDMTFQVKPHNLPVAPLLKKLTAGQRKILWGEQTMAVGARSKDGNLRFLLPMVRAAVAAALDGHNMVGRLLEITDKDTGGDRHTSTFVQVAEKKRADFVVLASLKPAGEQKVHVKLRVVDVANGETLATTEADDAIQFRTGPDILRNLRGLREGLDPATRHLHVTDEHLPVGVALWFTQHPKDLRAVGLVVVPESPELQGAVKAVQEAGVSSIREMEGVKDVEVLDASGAPPTRTDKEWSALASSRDVDAVVVVRLRQSADPDTVETLITAMDPQTEPRARLITRRGVTWALGTSDPKALKTFQARAYRAQVRALVTTYTSRYGGSSRSRDDVVVLVNKKGEPMEADEVLDLGVADGDRDDWESRATAAKVNRVLSWSTWISLGAGLATWLGCSVLGVLAGGAMLAAALVSATFAYPALGTMAAGVGVGCFGCCVINSVGNLVGYVGRAWFPGGVPTGSDLVLVARRHNLQLLKDHQVDPVLVEEMYFNDPL